MDHYQNLTGNAAVWVTPEKTIGRQCNAEYESLVSVVLPNGIRKCS